MQREREFKQSNFAMIKLGTHKQIKERERDRFSLNLIKLALIDF